MSIGTIVLTVVAVLIFFGALERVLDRMRLTDRAALFCYHGYKAESIPEWNIFDEYTGKE